MKIYSEITKKFYDDIEACEKAEKDFKTEEEKRIAKQNQLSEEKKARANEVNEAYKAVREAQKHYDKLKNDFIKDYGYFHMSYYEPNATSPFSIFEDLFRW